MVWPAVCSVGFGTVLEDNSHLSAARAADTLATRAAKVSILCARCVQLFDLTSYKLELGSRDKRSDVLGLFALTISAVTDSLVIN